MASPQFQFQRPAPTKGVILLIALCCVGWLATVIFEPVRAMLPSSLLLTATSIRSLHLWTILTHIFFVDDFLNLFFAGLMLYWFGSEVAQRRGDAKWLGFMFGATLLGGLLAAPVALLLGGGAGGPSAAVNACIAMYCWQIWNREVHFFTIALTGKTMFFAFLLIDFLFALFSMNPTLLAVKAGGALAGLLFATGTWRPDKLRRHYHYWRVKRNLKVVARTPEDKRRTKDGEWLN